VVEAQDTKEAVLEALQALLLDLVVEAVQLISPLSGKD